MQHYLWEDGNLMAAGMSFYAVFAVFAGVFVGFSVAGVWLSSSPALSDALITIINTSVPGLIGTQGLIDPKDLFNTSNYGWWGAIALLGLSWTAIGWMYYTRQAVRAIFQVPRDDRSFITKKLWDLALAAGIGVLLLVSAALSIVGTQFLEWLLGLFGFGPGSMLGRASGGAIAVISSVFINAVTLTVMFRILSRLRIPWRDLLGGVLGGSVVLAGLSVASGAVLDGASRNPLLAGFTLFVGLLLWFNLVSRVILISASWISVRLADSDVSLHEPSAAERSAELARARRLVAVADVRAARSELREASGFFERRRARKRLKGALAVARSVG
ncbi:membrane protein [Paramicrobacterium humi]|uniref:Membrane protein n=1 Tax=Paramicrobacterium humi TaxID=640635 RepID=A0A1H4IU74_9MICO|nr:membrane protein [Microbacterium humi]